METSTLEPQTVDITSVEPEEISAETQQKAQKTRKYVVKNRVREPQESHGNPKIGKAVYYWPHSHKEDGKPADDPCHAIIAGIKRGKVMENGDILPTIVCLAYLTNGGQWRQWPNVPFSIEPKGGHWSYPQD